MTFTTAGALPSSADGRAYEGTKLYPNRSLFGLGPLLLVTAWRYCTVRIIDNIDPQMTYVWRERHYIASSGLSWACISVQAEFCNGIENAVSLMCYTGLVKCVSKDEETSAK